jgi:hypothetical protein
MDNLLDHIEKRRWGIIVTFLVHVGVLLYLQIETYEVRLPERIFEVMSEVTEFEDYIEINPDHIISEEEFNANLNADVRNVTRDLSDKRDRSYDNFSQSSIDKKVEQSAKDLERQFFEEFASGRPSSTNGSNNNSGGGTSSATPSSTNNTSKSSTSENNTSASSGGDNQFAGNTMVDFELANRNPFNNNKWHIRNPGYTCGSGSNGRVAVAIRVNQNGDVVSARYVPEMSNGANSCMIEQAERYAKMSRFAFSSSAPKTQDGFIYYTFVSRK